MKKTTKTLKQILQKASTSKVFTKEYKEELSRLRLASDIRQFRTKQNMTQADVARKAAMPQSVIARIEGGNHSVSLDTLSRVAHVLGKEIQLV